MPLTQFPTSSSQLPFPKAKMAVGVRNILYYRGVNKAFHYSLLLLLLICSTHFLQAQVMVEDTTTHGPFFAAKKFNSKCYVGFEGTATQILKTKAALNLGLSLNWVINHKFVVSAKYHVLTSPLNIQPKVAETSTDTIRLTQHFAGLAFSYIFFNNKKFSLQPELAVGWGAAKYSHLNKTYRKDYAVILPALYGVYNATKYFRFGLGLNYRVAAGANLNGLSSADLSGVGGVIFIRVGTF